MQKDSSRSLPQSSKMRSSEEKKHRSSEVGANRAEQALSLPPAIPLHCSGGSFSAQTSPANASPAKDPVVLLTSLLVPNIKYPPPYFISASLLCCWVVVNVATCCSTMAVLQYWRWGIPGEGSNFSMLWALTIAL